MSSCSRPLLCASARRPTRTSLWATQAVRSMSCDREVLDDADVGDAGRERTLASRGDLVDLAELAGRDAPAQLLQRRVEALDVPDGADEPARLERLGHLAALLDGLGDRLLDQRVHAGLGELQAASWWNRVGIATTAMSMPAAMSASTSGRIASSPATPCGSPPGSATATRSTPGELAEHAGVVAAHHAEAEQPGAQLGHQAPASGERVDACDDALEVVFAERRVHRQREDLGAPRARSARGAGRVRSARATAGGGSGSGSRRRCRRRTPRERGDEPVAVVGDPDRVLVVDVHGAVGHGRHDDAAQVRGRGTRRSPGAARSSRRPWSAAPGRSRRGCRSSGC